MTHSIPQNPATIAAPAAGLRACALPGLAATTAPGEFLLPVVTPLAAGLPVVSGEVPAGGVVVYSAHGVAPSVRVPTRSASAANWR